MPAQINPEWVQRLFDMDTITRNLANISIQLNGSALKKSHTLIINAAKIELRLMGYHVKPNGYDLKKTSMAWDGVKTLTGAYVWRKSKTLSQQNTVKKSIIFYKGLHLFWTE